MFEPQRFLVVRGVTSGARQSSKLNVKKNESNCNVIVHMNLVFGKYIKFFDNIKKKTERAGSLNNKYIYTEPRL